MRHQRWTAPPSASVSWFDCNFEALGENKVTTDPKYVSERTATRPKDWTAILDLAQRASAAVPSPFARIDIYATPRGPIVGEITLAPGGLYYGKHYKLSDQMQIDMGRMWEEAKEGVLPEKV